MTNDITREQAELIHAMWRSLIDPHDKDRHEHPNAFAAERKWAIARPFDVALGVIEFFCWQRASEIDADMAKNYDYFHDAMIAEVDEAELDSIKDTDRTAWISGVADAFVLMGGDVLMQEWSDRGAMH
jgi:hypothetical protein